MKAVGGGASSLVSCRGVPSFLTHLPVFSSKWRALSDGRCAWFSRLPNREPKAETIEVYVDLEISVLLLLLLLLLWATCASDSVMEGGG